MACQQIALRYQVRRPILARLAPPYHRASLIQKRLLLDRFVELTGYSRKHAIFLLNHESSRNERIRRIRLPHYGPEVQQALFLTWKASRYVCAKRLVPFLPELIASLEAHGRLQPFPMPMGSSQTRQQARTRFTRLLLTCSFRRPWKEPSRLICRSRWQPGVVPKPWNGIGRPFRCFNTI